ncbi:MAG: penicillin-binding protein 1C [Thermodesulfobacteriota bacterium]
MEALINYEDRWFWYHPGVNPFSLIRASWQMLRSREIISGGSTLTMQVARLLDPHTRTFLGKTKQIFRALQLELHYSKKEILSFYLNRAPFGGTLEGVQAASYAYLGKSAKELSHAEAALLAVLPQAPSRLRPDRHPDRAQKARNKVLARLTKFKVWSENVIKDAMLEEVARRFHSQPMLAPLLARRFKKAARETGVLVTTIDANIQYYLEKKLASYISSFPEQTSSAILVVDNKTLEVKAYLGSADFENNQRFGHIDMVRAVRSPGSTLKPFLYGMAVDDGLIHSESLLIDAPQDFSGYRPSNFSDYFNGPISVRHALQHSLNLPAVDLLDHFSAARFISRLRNGGLRLRISDNYPSLAIILGGTGTTLEELVTAYTCFGRGGLSGYLRFTKKAPLVNRYLMSDGAAWIIRDILENNERPGLPVNFLNFSASRKVAWKTGTSYGFRDAWAVGVTDDYTIGVWVGRPDGTSSPGYFGAITASPLLFDVVDSLPRRGQWTSRPPRPKSVEKVEICWPLGTEFDPDNSHLCHIKREAWALNGIAPYTFPDRLQKNWSSGIVRYWVDSETGKRIDATCTSSANRQQKEVAGWPTALEPWLTPSLKSLAKLPEPDTSCAAPPKEAHKSLKIVGLNPQTVLHKAGPNVDLPMVTLRSVGGQSLLYWLVNGKLVHKSKPAKIFNYRFENVGDYMITVMDQTGNYDQVELRVIQ